MGHHRAHRGERRDPSATVPTASGGRRRAEPVRRPRRRPSGLPSAPMVAGVAVLALSAVGAASTQVQGVDVVSPVSHVSGLSAAANLGATHAGGTGVTAPDAAELIEDRQVVVSRDSRRDALAEKADEKLVAQAEAQAEQRNAALKQFRDAAEKQAAKIKLNQWVAPLDGYRISATFGQSSGLWANTHTGLDFAAPSGTPIYAVAGGVVTETGYDGSYGNKTVITLDDGTELWFCHQTSFMVNVGDVVRSGETIGTVGSTGNSTGPHLHLEVRPGGGDAVDPFTALLQHGVTP
jgi:murein DD-endopeptidase MepM/ murein hydrolase activator NlpD